MKAWRLVALMMSGVFVLGCDDEKSPATDTADTTDDTAPDTAIPDTEPEVEEDTALPDTEPEVEDTAGKTTWDAVHGIFATKCAPCHAGVEPDDGAGGHAIASGDKDIAYAASQRTSNFAQCVGKKVGECALTRILNGSMPQGKNCAGNPGAAGCVTAAEQQLIQEWLSDGMLR